MALSNFRRRRTGTVVQRLLIWAARRRIYSTSGKNTDSRSDDRLLCSPHAPQCSRPRC
jgi:hypothetical protein